MDFRPIDDAERQRLINALRGNAGGEQAILIDRRSTGFAGTSEEISEEEMISAIKSVPCHYAPTA
jgi:hypothetical protein